MKKILVYLVIALVSVLISYQLYRSSMPFLQQVDLRLKDTRFRIRGPMQPDPRVVVVAIDNKSIKEIGRWPWSREVMGDLVAALARSGAKVTALDAVFSEPQGIGPDAAFSRAIEGAGNVVMGYFFRSDEQKMDPEVLEQIGNSKVKLLKIASGVASVPLNEYSFLDGNIALLGRKARSFGFFNAQSDSDAVFRRAPLLYLFNGDVYPSLSLKALEQYLETQPMVDVAEFGVRSVSLGQINIPVNEKGQLSLNFYGPSGTFPTYSAVDVIKNRLPEGALKGKIAFVGATEIGIYDLRPTPLDPVQPGVDLHATVASNALQGKFLMHDSRTLGVEMGIMVALPFLLALVLAFVPSTVIGIACSLGTVALYCGANYWLFSRWLLDMSILYPVLPVFFLSVGAEGYRSLVVERKGRYMKKAFSNYVSADLVAQIMKNPDSLKLGGEKREISVLFTDIRGFTTLSESLSPEALVSLLNEYLSPMTTIVLEEKGTLDKYIGDAVMAIYNAPLDVPGHPEHACNTAIRMIRRLETLNESFKERGMQPIEIGAGINTGDAVVGNMGADMRFDYTAIGDTVNLASRLEGLNKLYGTKIIVSGTTKEGGGHEGQYRELDLVAVKGKRQPVAIYELLLEPSPIQVPFAEALARYRARDFAAALAQFQKLVDAYGDAPSALYVSRCRELLENPPPQEWDGVFVAKSK
ncbi:CHASE2 domain-containing protein [Geomesophilobacter sediminis]|uniref:Adenylate/guanylate cyclase domain-containing protein n=1 Tax=Geomesophilobacter sediminis TaxID=2798584 RepID=A0A8J7JKC3_9BACT|nr:adenylate/guanylate cyclase domain-containing protein [Geomesophilobacter sediminis]MBJ6723770.1 adenylate/guanylate cyclase domain-containing protein [Geomesophilobacter sediminis]